MLLYGFGSTSSSFNRGFSSCCKFMSCNRQFGFQLTSTQYFDQFIFATQA